MPRNRPRAVDSPRAQLLAGLPVEERRMQLHGVSTTVLEGGDGPPVVLLHGPGEYAVKWLRVIPDLASSHRTIVPDLPGHGSSEPLGDPPDAQRVLGWLDELIDRTCSRPPVLVGQILGGAIAARFASARSDRLDSVVLVDALGLAPFDPAPEFAQALGEFMADPTDDSHDRFWSLCAFDLDTLRGRLGDRWEQIKAYNLDRARTPALQATQHALMQEFGMPQIPAADLERIAAPTALIWGRHDLATSLTVAEAASARYGWPLHVIENAADDPPIEQPERFLQALRVSLGTSSGTAAR